MNIVEHDRSAVTRRMPVIEDVAKDNAGLGR